MNITETAEKVSETAFFKMIARGAMVVALPLGIIFGGYVYGVLKDRAEDIRQEVRILRSELQETQKKNEERVEDVDDRVDANSSKIAVIEANQQRAMLERIERDRKLDAQFQDLNVQVRTLTSTVAAQTAVLDALKSAIDRQSSLLPDAKQATTAIR